MNSCSFSQTNCRYPYKQLLTGRIKFYAAINPGGKQKNRSHSCDRLIVLPSAFQEHNKYVNSFYAKYQEQRKKRKKPESFNATYTKTDHKREVCDNKKPRTPLSNHLEDQQLMK